MGLMVKDLMADLETGNRMEEHIKNRLTPKPKEKVNPFLEATGWGSALGTATATMAQIQLQLPMRVEELRRVYGI